MVAGMYGPLYFSASLIASSGMLISRTLPRRSVMAGVGMPVSASIASNDPSATRRDASACAMRSSIADRAKNSIIRSAVNSVPEPLGPSEIRLPARSSKVWIGDADGTAICMKLS